MTTCCQVGHATRKIREVGSAMPKAHILLYFHKQTVHTLLRVMLPIRCTSINFFISPTEEISPMPPSSVSSGFSDDDSLRCDSSQSLSISQFVEYVLKKKRAGLIREYEEIKTRSFDGTFTVAKYDEFCLVFLCNIFFVVTLVSYTSKLPFILHRALSEAPSIWRSSPSGYALRM